MTMKARITTILALLIIAVTSSWAQDEVTVTAMGNANEWTFEMPEADVELEIEYETALALDEATDNGDALAEWNGYEADVTLTRTLQTGGWNTFCVPFNLATPTGWTVKELTGSSFADGTPTLNFATAESIEAGRPYLVKVDATAENPTFDGVIVTDGTTTSTETDNADFVPVMKPTFLTGGDKNVLFVTGGDKLTYPSADGNINGFRAYFQLKGDAVAEARAFRMSFDDNATGIQTLENLTISANDDSVFDLQGRRLSNGQKQKGVYIVRSAEGRLQGKNGKKTIIK